METVSRINHTHSFNVCGSYLVLLSELRDRNLEDEIENICYLVFYQKSLTNV